ncbi:MAG: DinB family protein [Chlorobiales bacterium]
MSDRLRSIEAYASHRYAEGKWSVKEIVGHLIDAERIFAYRALRIARGDKTALPGYDENAPSGSPTCFPIVSSVSMGLKRVHLLALLVALRNFNCTKIPFKLKFTCFAQHITSFSLNSLIAFHFNDAYGFNARACRSRGRDISRRTLGL